MFKAAPKLAHYFAFDTDTVTGMRVRLSGGRRLVEEIRTWESTQEAELRRAIEVWRGPRSSGQRYLFANCSLSTPDQIFRRITIEPKKSKDTTYLQDTIDAQLRIVSEEHTLAVLNAADGFDVLAPLAQPAKEVIVSGLPTKVVESHQNRLLELGIYPTRMALTALATTAAAIDYFAGMQHDARPVLLIELGLQHTQCAIISGRGVELIRGIATGLNDMMPVVQRELGLRDEDSARRLFFSCTFDFSGMGASLCRKMLKELQSSLGFYEVQTGQSIAQVAFVGLSPKVGWLAGVLAAQLGLTHVALDWSAWLATKATAWQTSEVGKIADVPAFPALAGLLLAHTTA